MRAMLGVAIMIIGVVGGSATDVAINVIGVVVVVVIHIIIVVAIASCTIASVIVATVAVKRMSCWHCVHLTRSVW